MKRGKKVNKNGGCKKRESLSGAQFLSFPFIPLDFWPTKSAKLFEGHLHLTSPTAQISTPLMGNVNVFGDTPHLGGSISGHIPRHKLVTNTP